ncbi:MAG: NADH-quinone oxidoreductase subunit A [Alphaproteobacteria bacterium]|nr:NADH-quinone oxidoreductase subunit A [Alphaproteobacteria bacterium]
MNLLLAEYLPIFVFLIIAIILSLIIVALPRFLAKYKPSKAKLSPYECGFDPFGDARDKFDIRFYLVAILFVIFDLEIMFLIPWSISLSRIGLYGFWSMMFFLGVLTIGLWYEYKKGALEWE